MFLACSPGQEEAIGAVQARLRMAISPVLLNLSTRFKK